MTKEELEKEAEEKYSEVDREFIACQDEGEVFNIGYILGAEPREKRIAELEKENAELKAENQKWKDEWQEQVQKATDEGYARTLQTMQLSKAKELLKQWLQTSKASGCDNINIVTDTEQFLKDSEVEK